MKATVGSKLTSIDEQPIALVGAQGYAHAARHGAARLYRALGREDVASELDHENRWLRESSVDLHYRREGSHTYTEVLRAEGDVRVTFVQRWED